MLAKKYKTELISIISPFEGIYTLEFKSLGRIFKYQPGQFLHLAIDEEYDGVGQWPDSRCFSMQSNPEEENIRITYSVKGGFTKRMEEKLKVGSELWLKLPYGELFTQPHIKINTVFIAGGTGVTPFLSLFTHDSFKQYINPHIYLGFRSKEFNIYKDIIDSLSNSFKTVKFYYQDTIGVIDIEDIFQSNGGKSSYFISGPPAMISTFKQILLAKGVQIGNILTDDWE